MAHVEKYQAHQLSNMLGHYDRSNNNISNPNVDRERSYLNYNLGPDRNISQLDFIEKRCSEVRCFKRADVIKMCDWIVTAPKDLPKEKEKDFFKETYSFLENRYGKDNVISAHVHMDETTPHVHFAFVPVVLDKKKGDLKVSGKAAVDRADLRTFHVQLQNHLEKQLGIPVGILNDVTKDGNLAMDEYKRLKASEDYRKALQLIEEAPKRAEAIIKEAEDRAGAIESEYQAKKAFLEQSGEFNLIEGVKEVRTVTGKVKEYKVPAVLWETQKISQMQRDAQTAMTREAEKTFRDYEKLQSENKTLRKELREALEENSLLKNTIQKLKELIRDMPKRFREAAKSIFRGLSERGVSQEVNDVKLQNMRNEDIFER